MNTLVVTPLDSALSPILNPLLHKQKFRAIVTSPQGCDTAMLVDYTFVVDDSMFFVLLEEHGHRAHLFMQHQPGAWVFRPVFRYNGEPVHNSLGPGTVQIACPRLEEFIRTICDTQ
jgi:hypothetical protein